MGEEEPYTLDEDAYTSFTPCSTVYRWEHSKDKNNKLLTNQLESCLFIDLMEGNFGRNSFWWIGDC